MTEKSAVISACGLYRYRLWRRWAPGPTTAFIMLNPSTADAEANDPTVRRCIAFAQYGGCGSLLIGNLFAYRATKPERLRFAADPVGPENDDHLRSVVLDATRSGGQVVCAWGTFGSYRDRDKAAYSLILSTGVEPICLRLTERTKVPEHPLYVPTATRPRRYYGPALSAFLAS